MHPRFSAAALLTVITLAACSTDLVAPAKAPRSPAMSVTSSQSKRYIVAVDPAAEATLAERVSALGGQIETFHKGAGIAIVSGLSSQGASALASAGVGTVTEDFAISINSPRVAIRADGAQLESTIQSQANPSAAILGFFQWNMALIKASTAWAAGMLGSPDVRVAILDSGIDYTSLDLIGQIDLTRSTSFMNHYVGVEDDPSTKEDESTPIVPADDIITTAFGRRTIDDLNGHGTNVATQVSSRALVFAGVTSRTKLMAVKVVGANGVGDFSDILNGVLYAADHDANVANMSLGGGFSKAGNGQFLALINRAFNYAKQKNMLIVVAAGNSGINLQHIGNGFATYCDAPHVICVSSVGPVTATGNPDLPAFYTNFGRNSADIAAPGGNAGTVRSQWPWSPEDPTELTDFDTVSWIWSMCAQFSLTITRNADGVNGDISPELACGDRVHQTLAVGTSQASPHVAGLAALLLAQHRAATPQGIKQLIQKSSSPINPAYGRGRIDVQAALGL